MTPQILQPFIEFLYGDWFYKELTRDQVMEKLSQTSGKSLVNEGVSIQRYTLRRKSGDHSQHLLFELQQELSTKTQKIKGDELFDVNYLACLLSYEGFQVDNAKHYLAQLVETYKATYSKEKEARYCLLKVLIHDVANYDVDSTLLEYQNVLNRLQNIDGSPYLLTLIFAGAYCRKIDNYEQSEKFLMEALNSSDQNSEIRALILSNIGSLHYTKDSFETASNYYRQAKNIYDEKGDIEAVRRTLHLAVMSEDVNDWKRGVIPQNRSKFSEYEALPVRTDDQFVHQTFLDGLQGYSDEIFQESSRGPYTRRLSSNVSDALRQLDYAAYIADHLGNAIYYKQLLKINARNLFNTGVIRDEAGLIALSLSLFILVNNEDGVKAIASKYFPLKNNDEVSTFIEWLLSIKGDRDALLGTIDAFRECAPYIPDKYIPSVCSRLLELSNRGYTFIGNFDFERPCIQALSNIISRLDAQSINNILGKYLPIIKDCPPAVREELIRLLGNIPWKLISLNERKEILGLVKDLLKTRTIPSQDALLNLLCLISNDIDDTSPKEIVNYLFELFKAESFLSAPFLTYPWMKDRLDLNQIDIIVSGLLRKLENDLSKSSLNRYGFGGPDYILSLGGFFDKLSGEKRTEVIEYLTKMLKASNVWPDNKISCAQFIQDNAEDISKEDQHKLIEALSFVLENPYPNDVKNNMSRLEFFGSSNFLRLDAEIITALALLDKGKGTKYYSMLHNMILSIDYISGPSVIQALGEIANNNPHTSIKSECMNLLYFCTSDLLPPNVQASAVTVLGRLLRNKTESDITNRVIVQLNKLSNHKHFQVRLAVARAIIKMPLLEDSVYNDQLIYIKNILKNDIHYSVRQVVQV